MAVVVYPLIRLLADRFLLASHPANAVAVGVVVTLVTLVPPLAMGSVPVTPVVNGRPVALVRTATDGVPIFGVVSVGELFRTTLPEPVAVVAPVPPLVMGIALPE